MGAFSPPVLNLGWMKMTLTESRCCHEEGPGWHQALLAVFLLVVVWSNDGLVQLAGTCLKTSFVCVFFFDVMGRKVRTTSVTM